MSNRAAGGEKWIQKCGQALFIDRDASFAYNSTCNSQHGHRFSWMILFTYLRQLFCILPFVIKDHTAGTARGSHTKPFSKQSTGPASQSGGMYGMWPEYSFFQNNGEHIKMKFETSNLRSCTDEDNYENAKYGMRIVASYEQRSRLNAVPSRHDPLLLRSSTVIGEVCQMKDRSSSTALAVSTSSATYLCPHGAERRGCT